MTVQCWRKAKYVERIPEKERERERWNFQGRNRRLLKSATKKWVYFVKKKKWIWPLGTVEKKLLITSSIGVTQWIPLNGIHWLNSIGRMLLTAGRGRTQCASHKPGSQVRVACRTALFCLDKSSGSANFDWANTIGREKTSVFIERASRWRYKVESSNSALDTHRQSEWIKTNRIVRKMNRETAAGKSICLTATPKRGFVGKWNCGEQQVRRSQTCTEWSQQQIAGDLGSTMKSYPVDSSQWIVSTDHVVLGNITPTTVASEKSMDCWLWSADLIRAIGNHEW